MKNNRQEDARIRYITLLSAGQLHTTQQDFILKNSNTHIFVNTQNLMQTHTL